MAVRKKLPAGGTPTFPRQVTVAGRKEYVVLVVRARSKRIELAEPPSESREARA